MQWLAGWPSLHARATWVRRTPKHLVCKKATRCGCVVGAPTSPPQSHRDAIWGQNTRHRHVQTVATTIHNFAKGHVQPHSSALKPNPQRYITAILCDTQCASKVMPVSAPDPGHLRTQQQARVVGNSRRVYNCNNKSHAESLQRCDTTNIARCTEVTVPLKWLQHGLPDPIRAAKSSFCHKSSVRSLCSASGMPGTGHTLDQTVLWHSDQGVRVWVWHGRHTYVGPLSEWRSRSISRFFDASADVSTTSSSVPLVPGAAPLSHL